MDARVAEKTLAWPQCSILVVDDEAGMRNFLVRSLAPRCARIEAADSVETAEALMRRFRFDLLILDIKLPGKSGVDWLAELREKGYAGDVILVTAFADLETAINALRAGASDFMLKPFRLPQLINAIQRCHERSRLARENFVLRRELDGRHEGIEELIGESQIMRTTRALIQRVAPLPTTVLITGESGTGKEVAARALHRMSPRGQGPHAGPFVPLNCAAIGPELMESELFGHVRGAFTGATQNRDGLFYYANGGTLFLDEIAELPLPLQAKLLRALEEHKIRPVGSEQEIPVDVRIIAATNRHLPDEVAVSRFRQDLYYRLQVVEIRMPALRDHAADIPALVEHFNHKLAQQLGVPSLSIAPEILRRMMADYDWPGNVRELKNWVERSLILGEPRLDFLPAPSQAPSPADLPLDELERRHILDTLKATGGNKSEAARRLGISRKTLERRCAAWGI